MKGVKIVPPTSTKLNHIYYILSSRDEFIDFFLKKNITPSLLWMWLKIRYDLSSTPRKIVDENPFDQTKPLLWMENDTFFFLSFHYVYSKASSLASTFTLFFIGQSLEFQGFFIFIFITS